MTRKTSRIYHTIMFSGCIWIFYHLRVWNVVKLLAMLFQRQLDENQKIFILITNEWHCGTSDKFQKFVDAFYYLWKSCFLFVIHFVLRMKQNIFYKLNFWWWWWYWIRQFPWNSAIETYCRVQHGHTQTTECKTNKSFTFGNLTFYRSSNGN